jgi:hypothetical protein
MLQLKRQLGLDVVEEENTTNTGKEDGERTSKTWIKQPVKYN